MTSAVLEGDLSCVALSNLASVLKWTSSGPSTILSVLAAAHMAASG